MQIVRSCWAKRTLLDPLRESARRERVWVLDHRRIKAVVAELRRLATQDDTKRNGERKPGQGDWFLTKNEGWWARW